MTLVGRTSAFFLGVLAVALLAFTVGLCLLVRADRYREVDQRLEATLASLSAAAETNPRGFEWDAREHPLALGVQDGPEHVRWLICDGDGRLVAVSENLQFDEGDEERRQQTDAPYHALAENGQAAGAGESLLSTLAIAGDPWRVASRRLEARDPRPPAAGKTSTLLPALVLSSGVNLRPVQQSLNRLLILSLGISAGLWGAAAVLGRWLCRRAIAPLTDMAGAARRMSAEALGQRLPSPGTADELHDLSLAFNDLLARVQVAFERQRRFTSEASHQLRTPLTAVLGQVEVALRHERSGDDYRETLRRVERQTRRLTQIVEVLLFLARADAEAQLPNLESIDLAAWLKEHLTGWGSHARAADFVIEASDGLPAVRGHAVLLGQLLDNLLDNACKYSSPGTPVHVRLAPRRGGLPPHAQAALEVEDQGLGISSADVAHLFEPFFRAAEVRRQGVEGMGLGLAVVKRIADALGGALSVESRAGQGSTFRVEFPVCAVVAPGVVEPRSIEREDFGPALPHAAAKAAMACDS